MTARWLARFKRWRMPPWLEKPLTAFLSIVPGLIILWIMGTGTVATYKSRDRLDKIEETFAGVDTAQARLRLFTELREYESELANHQILSTIFIRYRWIWQVAGWLGVAGGLLMWWEDRPRSPAMDG